MHQGTDSSTALSKFVVNEVQRVSKNMNCNRRTWGCPRWCSMGRCPTPCGAPPSFCAPQLLHAYRTSAQVYCMVQRGEVPHTLRCAHPARKWDACMPCHRKCIPGGAARRSGSQPGGAKCVVHCWSCLISVELITVCCGARHRTYPYMPRHWNLHARDDRTSPITLPTGSDTAESLVGVCGLAGAQRATWLR